MYIISSLSIYSVLCSSYLSHIFIVFFFFNDTATTEIYTLSLHDALPILPAALLPVFPGSRLHPGILIGLLAVTGLYFILHRDRKSTRLNSSHANISYAVFCLKKKKKKNIPSLD